MKKISAVAAATVIGLVLLSLTGVRAEDDADKSQATNITGTWTGDDSGSDNNGNFSGPMTLTVAHQQGDAFKGTFMLTTGDETPSGPFNGKFTSSNEIKANFHAGKGSKHPCVAKVTASISSGTMTGSWTVNQTKHCQGTGTFTLQHQ